MRPLPPQLPKGAGVVCGLVPRHLRHQREDIDGYCTFSGGRYIWWEHLCGRYTGSDLCHALQWAARLHCWLPVAASSQGGVAASSQGGGVGQALANTVKGKKGAVCDHIRWSSGQRSTQKDMEA